MSHKNIHFWLLLGKAENFLYDPRIYIFFNDPRIYIYIYIYIRNLDDRSRGWPKSSIYSSYYTEVELRMVLLSPECSIYPWSLPYNTEC